MHWNRAWDSILLRIYAGASYRKLAWVFGVPPGAIRQQADRLKLPVKHTLLHGGRRSTRYRAPHEFNTATKRQRFAEEGGRCQWCHKLIGDGTSWKDTGPDARVTYHHIHMICRGGDAAPENCMVLHKECHGGGRTGLPLNRVLHNGMKADYTRMWKEREPQCSRSLLRWTDEDLLRVFPTVTNRTDLMRGLGYATPKGESTYRVQEALDRLGLAFPPPDKPERPTRVPCHICGTTITPAKKNLNGPWFCSKRCVGVHSRA